MLFYFIPLCSILTHSIHCQFIALSSFLQQTQLKYVNLLLFGDFDSIQAIKPIRTLKWNYFSRPQKIVRRRWSAFAKDHGPARVVCQNSCVVNGSWTFSRTFSYLPSCRASPPFGCYSNFYFL